MGTRGLFGFSIDGKKKVAYNHFDSYPEGLGQDAVNAVQAVIKDNKIEQLKANIANLKMITGNEEATLEEQTRYKKFADTKVSTRQLSDWYVLMRDLQGADIIPHIVSGEVEHMVDGEDFLKDTLFCEWAYIINLDNNMFEVYGGRSNNMIDSFPLDNIPKNWTEIIYEKNKE